MVDVECWMFSPLCPFLTFPWLIGHTLANGTHGSGVDSRGVARRLCQFRAVGDALFSEGFCDRPALCAAGERGGRHCAGNMAQGVPKAEEFPGGGALRTLVNAPCGSNL